MNNTQLAAEVAALRERINTLEHIVSDDYHASTVTADDFTTPEPLAPAPGWEEADEHPGAQNLDLDDMSAPDDAAKWIDPARLVVTDAMLDAAGTAWHFDRRLGTRYQLRLALEAAFAVVKGDDNGK